MLRILVIFIFFVLTACSTFTPETIGISSSEWNNYSPAKQQEIINNHNDLVNSARLEAPETSNNSCLQVNISDGAALMPPFTAEYPYYPASIKLADGTCKTVILTAKEEGDRQITMCACYFNNALFLDPSLYEKDKKFGSIRMRYSSLWDDGFTYHKVTSSGYVHLQDATVTVKHLSAEDCK